jgi:DNA-directed RNA polymerase subunit RPC12/RpoP
MKQIEYLCAFCGKQTSNIFHLTMVYKNGEKSSKSTEKYLCVRCAQKKSLVSKTFINTLEKK